MFLPRNRYIAFQKEERKGKLVLSRNSYWRTVFWKFAFRCRNTLNWDLLWTRGVHGKYLSILLWGSCHSQTVWSRLICFCKIFCMLQLKGFQALLKWPDRCRRHSTSLFVLFYPKGSESKLNGCLFEKEQNYKFLAWELSLCHLGDTVTKWTRR